MRKKMKVGDIIVNSPPKGNGASLTIKYKMKKSCLSEMALSAVGILQPQILTAINLFLNEEIYEITANMVRDKCISINSSINWSGRIPAICNGMRNSLKCGAKIISEDRDFGNFTISFRLSSISDILKPINSSKISLNTKFTTMKSVILNINKEDIEFKLIPIEIIEQNLENIWKGNNKRTLRYYLDKALDEKNIRNNPHPLKKKASSFKIKYENLLDFKLSDFINHLKTNNNLDYLFFLNKYGDNKFCRYRVSDFLTDNGIYCYTLNNVIMYLGRCIKTFNERINVDYGKITPYNCLIDGQATDCHINSLVNEFSFNGELKIGIYKMTGSSSDEIKQKEKLILNHFPPPWNIQQK
jgi:hypothetical protein